MLLCGHVDQVEEKLFMAFAMQPQVSEMSYAGANGSAFTYYRAEDSQPRVMFGSPCGKWYTKAADPATSRPIGCMAVAPPRHHLPNAGRALADAKSGSLAALGAGCAHPGDQMLVFSKPVGDAGVVSAVVPIDDIMAIAKPGVGHGRLPHGRRVLLLDHRHKVRRVHRL
jgi:hypothetical protein